jgi:hypothetical protein
MNRIVEHEIRAMYWPVLSSLINKVDAMPQVRGCKVQDRPACGRRTARTLPLLPPPQ